MILKSGTRKIVAVGEVVRRGDKHRGENDKEWLLDLDGWVLPAYCFVDWRAPTSPVEVKGLTRDTIKQCHIQPLRDIADALISTLPVRPQCPEPLPVETVDDSHVLAFLIRHGFRAGAADDLMTTFGRIRLLARYYYDYYGESPLGWNDLREHEIRTFLIIPLLLALGWSEQQLKIELPLPEGGRIDIACFPHGFHNDLKGCTLLIESKGFSQGLDYAHEQAKDYAKVLEECRVVFVSNGYCYKAYSRGEGQPFPKTPTAYLNILRPTAKYHLDPAVGGSLAALRLMLPSR
jgi:hypothetical protein